MRYDTIQRLRNFTKPRDVMGKGQKSIFIGEPLQRMLDRTTLPLTTVVNVMADRLDRLSMQAGELSIDDPAILYAVKDAVTSTDKPYTARDIDADLAGVIEARGHRRAARLFAQLPYSIKLAFVLQAERGEQ